MRISVPVFEPANAYPKIDASKIPVDQHGGLEHVSDLLRAFISFEEQFNYALLLCHSCQSIFSNSGRAPPRESAVFPVLPTISAWQHMAARDGALAIYHFGWTIQGLWATLNTECRSLLEQIDEEGLRAASNEFNSNFPRYEIIRHVVGHAAEWSAFLSKKETHSLKGAWEIHDDRVSLQMGGNTRTQFLGRLFGRTFVVTYDGEPYTYQITPASAAKLETARLGIYSAFDPVIARPES